ncbi:MAG: ROK family protein [Actinobacteria bacterium]|nr:ROK family protein [Actinomycetota bacterium]
MTKTPSFTSPSSKCTIGVDIGGTKLAAGIVTEDGRILERILDSTPQTDSGSATLEVLSVAVKRLREYRPDVSAIGVGAAGMVEWPSGYIRWAPNNAYQELPLRELLAQETGLPVVVENDANAAAAGEGRIGSGAGYSDSVTLTVGTGIGGGIILNGQLYRGPTGIGAEVGHLIVNPKTGATCGCGATGCLEAMASGIALGRSGRQAARADPTGVLATLAGSPEHVTGEVVFEAARHGDPIARELFDQLGYWLGVGIASLVNILDTQIVIVGGGIGECGDVIVIDRYRGTSRTWPRRRARGWLWS